MNEEMWPKQEKIMKKGQNNVWALANREKIIAKDTYPLLLSPKP